MDRPPTSMILGVRVNFAEWAQVQALKKVFPGKYSSNSDVFKAALIPFLGTFKDSDGVQQAVKEYNSAYGEEHGED